ncbi:hypothetical protein TYRP_020140, partial [Tyrophagus putrescentiae]
CVPQRLVRFDSPCKCCELAAIIVDALVLRNFPVDVWARAPIEALYKKAVHYNTNDQFLECGSSSALTQDHLNLPVSLPSPEMGVVVHEPVESKTSISSPVVLFLPPPVPPPEPSFLFPEVPSAGELLMMELEENRRYRQAKENLISPPPTPITFSDL